MQTKRIHYGFAAVTFLVALYTYTATMQPSIPFWDCGEFAAAARSLSIPHPPGAPLWTIVGRIALLLPTFSDPVARYNFFSALASAVSVMLLYLIIVRLIKMWRGAPQSTADIITHYGGALVGALSYCWTDSFWFNALECEVYAFGSLFISLIPWLMLVWYDHADEEHSEKWLLLVFYVIGLSMGVHQLALLTLFPIFMLVYYKHWRGKSDHYIWGYSVSKWLLMALVATVAFAISFLVILSDIVTWLGTGGGLRVLAILLLVGMPAGIYWSQKNNKPAWNITIWAATFLFLGFTTYMSLLVRASQDPPMNQHHVSNFKALHEFIDRDQYGQVSLNDEFFHRRLEQQKEDHARTWDENLYKSDGDFFWKYQTDKMFLRYWEWNFIGRKTDAQDAGVDWTKTAGIPIILGLFGLFWHFRRDPKRAFSLLAMFIIMGFVTAWYQNQQDPQPRERDYFYVGAFYAYAMWIGIGATGILEFIRSWYAKRQDQPLQEAGPIDREVRDPEGDTIPPLRGTGPTGILAGVLALLVILVPINQCIGLVGQVVYGQTFKKASKWGEYSRKHDNVPLEYAYNVLQTCEPDAILFTAGDNDTFPLWALQDVYGVRTDVRIVNLSLGNMGWYIKQLKDQHIWGAKTIKLPSFTEEMLANEDETPGGVHTQPFAQGGEPPMDPPIVTVTPKPETMTRFGGNPSTAMQWKFTSQHAYQGKYYYTVSDQLVRDIVMYNMDDRPIYFALGVPPSYWNGLDDYVVFSGLAARVVPVVHPGSKSGLGGDIEEAVYRDMAYNLAPTIETKPVHSAILNSFRDPEANRSDLEDRTGWETNFQMYGRLAFYYLNKGNNAEASRALDTLTARLPPQNVTYDPAVLQEIARLYKAAGNSAMSNKYSKWTLDALKNAEPGPSTDADPNAAISKQFQLAQLSYAAGDYVTARKGFNDLLMQFPQANDPNREFVQFYLDAMDAKELAAKGNKQGALAKYTALINAYSTKNQQIYAQDLQDLMLDRSKLMKDLGQMDSGKAPALAQPQTKDGVTKPGQPNNP